MYIDNSIDDFKLFTHCFLSSGNFIIMDLADEDNADLIKTDGDKENAHKMSITERMNAVRNNQCEQYLHGITEVIQKNKLEKAKRLEVTANRVRYDYKVIKLDQKKTEIEYRKRKDPTLDTTYDEKIMLHSANYLKYDPSSASYLDRKLAIPVRVKKRSEMVTPLIANARKALHEKSVNDSQKQKAAKEKQRTREQSVEDSEAAVDVSPECPVIFAEFSHKKEVGRCQPEQALANVSLVQRSLDVEQQGNPSTGPLGQVNNMEYKVQTEDTKLGSPYLPSQDPRHLSILKQKQPTKPIKSYGEPVHSDPITTLHRSNTDIQKYNCLPETSWTKFNADIQGREANLPSLRFRRILKKTSQIGANSLNSMLVLPGVVREDSNLSKSEKTTKDHGRLLRGIQYLKKPDMAEIKKMMRAWSEENQANGNIKASSRPALGRSHSMILRPSGNKSPITAASLQQEKSKLTSKVGQFMVNMQDMLPKSSVPQSPTLQLANKKQFPVENNNLWQRGQAVISAVNMFTRPISRDCTRASITQKPHIHEYNPPLDPSLAKPQPGVPINTARRAVRQSATYKLHRIITNIVNKQTRAQTLEYERAKKSILNKENLTPKSQVLERIPEEDLVLSRGCSI
jgi:hypothetical protein